MSWRLALGALLATTTLASAAGPAQLQPFRATYAVVWHGFDAGIDRTASAAPVRYQYVYTSRSNASGLFRAFFSNEISQTSWLTVTPDGIRPDRYRADDGSSRTARDISLDFNWEAGRARGVAEDQAVDVALEPHTQDDLSITIALMYALLDGEQPSIFRLIDKDRIKEYRFTPEGRRSSRPPLVTSTRSIYRSQRSGSKRVTRMWYAPALGYVPVRGEQLRDGKREWQMDIRSLQRE